MHNNLLAKFKSLNLKQRTIAAVSILIIAVLIALAITQLATPKRSVAAYCKVYTQEKARISKLPGDTYPSLLFDHPQNNADEFAVSLGRLEKVAPDEIRPDVATLKSLYEKLHKDPSQIDEYQLCRRACRYQPEQVDEPTLQSVSLHHDWCEDASSEL
jgi:hypothetical protein